MNVAYAARRPSEHARAARSSVRMRRRRLLAGALSAAVASCLCLAPAAAAAQADGRPTVAVVLGGGAARGLSHIGLLRALEEHGIPIDILVGTSMGSIVAGLYAAGLSVENLTYLATQLDLNRLFAPRIPPRGGLVDAEPFAHFLDQLTGGIRMEETPIPFYSVLADLRTGETVALNRGPIGKAIVASMSIPGIFPPVEIEGRLYVDGGLVSSVPVRAARAAGADFVIAVDVRRDVDAVVPGNVLANLQLALSVLLDKQTDAEVLDADVLITPAVADSSYMEFDRAEHFIAEGYRAALAAMDELKAALRRLDPSFRFDAPRRQPGIPMEDFPRLAGEAAAVAMARARRSPQATAELTFSTQAAPRAGLAVHIPLRWARLDWPLFAAYSLRSGEGGWHHAVAAGAGSCAQLCGGVFTRGAAGNDVWSLGLMASGTLGAGRSPSGAAAWHAFWERRPDESGDAWRLQVQAPAPTALTVVGSELQLQVGRDPHGLYGPPGEAVRASALWRRYQLGEPQNVLELLRGAVHWYVGVGVGATYEAGVARLYPAAEAGLLFEGRLFGLYAARSRLSLSYEAGTGAWLLRLTIGD